MKYFIDSWDDLSKEIEVDMPDMQNNINQLKLMTKKNNLDMNRLLNDADSSMIQLFTKRLEENQCQMTEGEKYERLQEFKEYLRDEFNLSNLLLERYIDDELGVDNNIKMLRYDRIIMKYTTKFKLTKRQRLKYTLHEPVIDMNERLKVVTKD